VPLVRFFQSSIGLKILMAVTGIILFGFVFVHMLGNLQIFGGAEPLNAYGNFLHSQPELLWSVRAILLLSVFVHILAGWGLALHNRAARPISYATDTAVGASWASRTMAVSGTIVLLFIIFHILHFTTGTIKPAYSEYRDGADRHDVFRMVVEAFSNPWIAWVYVISVGLVCLHLSHGLSSLFRSLGWMNSAYRPLQLWFARTFATLIFVGMVAVPLSVQFGFVRLAGPS
jgi:succinate dehydrogenase / fumarate reductase cytochrome b subunit